MADQQHTPGPWSVRDNLPGMEGEVWIYAPNGREISNRMVAVIGDMEMADTEDLANAHLMAAAPDLLAACESFVGSVQDQNKLDDTELGERVSAALTLALAAIAKARGEREASNG